MPHITRRPRRTFATRLPRSGRSGVSGLFGGRRRPRRGRRTQEQITQQRVRDTERQFGGQFGLRESVRRRGRLFTVGQGKRVAEKQKDILLTEEREELIGEKGRFGFGIDIGTEPLTETELAQQLTKEQQRTLKRRRSPGGGVRPRTAAEETAELTEEQRGEAEARTKFEVRRKAELTERREKDIIRRFGSLEQFEETQGRIGSAVQAEKGVLQNLKDSAKELDVEFSEFKGEFLPARDVIRTFFKIKSGPNAGRARTPSSQELAERILKELKSGTRGNKILAQRFIDTMGDRLIPSAATRGQKGGKAFKEILEKQAALRGKIREGQQRFRTRERGTQQDIALGAGIDFAPGSLEGFEDSEEFEEFRRRFAKDEENSHLLENGAGAFGTHNGEDHLDLDEGQSLNQDPDTGQFSINEDDIDVEMDPRLRAEERLSRDRELAEQDITDKFSTPLQQLEGETLIGGRRSRQQKKRISRLKRRQKKSRDRLELRFTEGKEDIFLQELERQRDVEEKAAARRTPEALQKTRLQQEQLAGTNGVLREFSDKGEDISFLKAQNIWLDRQKFNSSAGAQFSERSEVLDETVLSAGFDKNLAYETVVQKFDDDVLQAEKYLKSRGFLDSEIKLQKEAFQRDVLGFTQEQIDASKKGESKAQQQSSFLEGSLKSTNLGSFLDNSEITMGPAAYQRMLDIALGTGNLDENGRLLVQARKNLSVAREGGGGLTGLQNTLAALETNPNLYGGLGQGVKDDLIANGFIPPIGASLSENQRVNLETTIIKNFDAGTKEARSAQRQIRIMNASLVEARKAFEVGGDINAASQGILVTFQKMLDPTSVVRESEYARSGDGQSLFQRIEGEFQRLEQGGAGVTLEGLENFVKLGNVFLKGYEEDRISLARRSQRRADKYGFDEDIIFDPNTLKLLKRDDDDNARRQEIFDRLTPERRQELEDDGHDFSSFQSGATGTRPIRNQNPINLKSGGIGDEFAQKDEQGNVVTDDQGHLIFDSPEDGIEAGKADLKAKVEGRSRFLDNNPTIAELGKVFAEDPNWPRAVASILGVDINTPTQDIDFEELFRAVARQEGGAQLLTINV